MRPAAGAAPGGAGALSGPVPAGTAGREPAQLSAARGPRFAVRWLALVPLFVFAVLGWLVVKPALSPQASGPARQATPSPAPGLGYEGYLNQSVAYYNAGDYPGSIAAAGMALQIVPRSSLAYNNICASENQLKQWDGAIQACQQALAIDPAFALAQNNLAAARQGKAAASSSASPQPPSPTPHPFATPAPSAAAQADVLIAASVSAYRASNYQGCVQAAQTALAFKPDSALAYNDICACENQLKQWGRAIAACQNALAIEPGFTLAQNNLKVARQGQQ